MVIRNTTGVVYWKRTPRNYATSHGYDAMLKILVQYFIVCLLLLAMLRDTEYNPLFSLLNNKQAMLFVNKNNETVIVPKPTLSLWCLKCDCSKR